MEKEDYQPKDRYAHSTVIIDNQLYMWVGLNGNRRIGVPRVHASEEKNRFCSCIEVFDITEGKWYQKPTTGNPPLGIKGYSAVAIKNEIFYFGGWCGHSNCYHNSLYSLNVDTLQWRELSPSTFASGHPSMKQACGMVHVQFSNEHYLAVFGGVCSIFNSQTGAQYDNNLNNEVHYFSLSLGQWISPEVRGDRPPPCCAFTLTSITNDSAIMFGGMTNHKYMNNVYIATFTRLSVEWKKVQQSTDPSVKWPKERESHSSVLINTTVGPHLLVIGGDCWLLSINTGIWREFTEALPSIVTNRRSHSLSVWSVTPTTVWIIEFGGISGVVLGDTVIIEIRYGTLYEKCQRAVLSMYEDLNEIESFLSSHLLKELNKLKAATSLLRTTNNFTSLTLNILA